MVTVKEFRKMVMSFPGAVESPHFDKSSFRVKKKIFCTLAEAEKVVTVKLPEAIQSVFCSAGPAAVSIVANKWGKQGWTSIQLDKVPEDLLAEALDNSFNHVISSGKNK